MTGTAGGITPPTQYGVRRDRVARKPSFTRRCPAQILPRAPRIYFRQELPEGEPVEHMKLCSRDCQLALSFA